MSIPADIEAVEFAGSNVIRVKINSDKHNGYEGINIYTSPEAVEKIKQKIVRILNRYE